ncbi:hypothetical protein ACEYW6_28035 [Nostoc sp. UIC 10607]|uniref:hypothetical protein n=1 Tax=Nostoc sp. UIC 10607 TaxID=3045935 RepID=UPI0039A2B092
MRQDTEDWFSNIKDQEPIQTKFDIYYFCLMLGFSSGRCSNPAKKCPEFTDFVDNFVKDYRSSQTLIIGLLLRTELSRLGISINEKDEIRNLLLDLVDPTTQTNLTDKGMDKMNEYASGGYDYIAEQLDSKPYHVEEFLITYTNLLQEAVDNNPKWQSATVEHTEILEQI